MKHTFSAGGVVINKGRILIVNQNNNSWSLPKGHIDAGEDALTAAKREIYEESGIFKLKFIKDLGMYDRYKLALDGEDDPSELKSIHMFMFETDQEKLQPIDKDNPEARWLSEKEALEILTHPKDREFLIKTLKDANF